MTAAEKFRRLLQHDSRYDAEAYGFVYEALDFTLKNIVKKSRNGQHVSGRELLEGIRQYSIDQFGCLARPVLESWGVRATDDVGEMVFRLVEFDLMGKQDSDRLEDFRGVYEFEDVFDLAPVFHYSKDRNEWTTRYLSRKQFESLRS